MPQLGTEKEYAYATQLEPGFARYVFPCKFFVFFFFLFFD